MTFHRKKLAGTRQDREDKRVYLDMLSKAEARYHAAMKPARARFEKRRVRAEKKRREAREAAKRWLDEQGDPRAFQQVGSQKVEVRRVAHSGPGVDASPWRVGCARRLDGGAALKPKLTQAQRDAIVLDQRVSHVVAAEYGVDSSIVRRLRSRARSARSAPEPRKPLPDRHYHPASWVLEPEAR